jgi:hypothetical protein
LWGRPGTTTVSVTAPRAASTRLAARPSSLATQMVAACRACGVARVGGGVPVVARGAVGAGRWVAGGRSARLPEQPAATSKTATTIATTIARIR